MSPKLVVDTTHTWSKSKPNWTQKVHREYIQIESKYMRLKWLDILILWGIDARGEDYKHKCKERNKSKKKFRIQVHFYDAQTLNSCI